MKENIGLFDCEGSGGAAHLVLSPSNMRIHSHMDSIFPGDHM